MRKFAAAALAVPVLAIIYLPLLARRSVAARLGLVASVGIVVLVGAFGLSRPAATTATQPAAPITALPDDAFRSIGASTELRAAVDITFSEAMDPTSVAASLTVTPSTPIQLSWDDTRTVLTVRPASHWTPGTYNTISIAAGTLAAGGRPMANVVHAAFVTRPATSARITPTQPIGDGVSIATGFRVTFDRPVSITAVEAALRISPAVAGRLIPDADGSQVVATAARGFTFTPSSMLTGGTNYRVSLDPLLDADGADVSTVGATTMKTTAAPRVTRFRPTNGTTKVERGAALSVRFSEPMNKVTTRAAYTVSANGKPIAGKVRFAESNTVLVFQPTSALPAGAKVVISVAASATSAVGVPLAKTTSVTVTVVPKPKVASRAPTTRSGGSTGGCSSPGGRSVAPLKLSAGISSHVSRPYAKKLAVNNLCSHFIGGNPGDRLRAAGYTSYRWAENLGCRSGNPYSAVLGSHLYFQSEKPYNGGHYVNLMNAAYDRVGIGVWVSGGRVRLVVDFYHPL